MTEQEKTFLAETDEFLKNCQLGLKALDALNRAKEFALNEWKTNKRWFREEPGKVTTEDVIRQCIEFGWSSRQNFDAQQNREELRSILDREERKKMNEVFRQKLNEQ